MRQQLENRLQILRAELEKGQARLQELDAERNSVSATVLRISGAIQVLQEELADTQPTSPTNAALDSHDEAQLPNDLVTSNMLTTDTPAHTH